MGDGQQVTALSRAEAASLLGWWLEAGVDVGIAEEARNWLAPPRAPGPAPLPLAEEAQGRPAAAGDLRGAAPSAQPAALSERASVPATLDAYHQWLAESAELPLFRAGASRALPHGPAQAEVMLLTGIPSPEDAAEGRPIAGAAWQLTVRMLAAIGLVPDQAYVAALTCFSSAGSRPSEGDMEACRDTLLHQLKLAAPKRLLLLGDGPSKLLLGTGLLASRGKVHRVQGIPTIVTFPPRHLLERSADKALAWRDLLLLMGESL